MAGELAALTAKRLTLADLVAVDQMVLMAALELLARAMRAEIKTMEMAVAMEMVLAAEVLVQQVLILQVV